MRTEHIDHFKHNGINAQYGWKSVVPGIELVARQMKTGHFFVKKSAPVKFLDEIYNYQWDDKNEDAVVKENDDCMVTTVKVSCVVCESWDCEVTRCYKIIKNYITVRF